jgi:16S rRNA G1207 methylase RsmC
MDGDATAALRQDLVWEEQLAGRTLTLSSTWGLFSPKRLDDGTRLLIDHLEAPAAGRCLDLGCGYGAIGLALACRCPQGQVHLVDKDFVAVAYAGRNARRNGLHNCVAYLSNGFSHVPPQRFDVIATNLPAKVGAEMLTLLLTDARDHLAPGGALYVVALSGLKDYVKRSFRTLFGNYEKVKQGQTYTVSRACRDDPAPAAPCGGGDGA